MNRILKIALCLTAIVSLNASAKIWRINNTGIPANFTSIQQANDTSIVQAGDTLHLEPSPTTYGTLIASKKLIIIGPGYYLNENQNQQQNITSAKITSFDLYPGSGGTVISGLKVTGNNFIRTGNVSINRNLLDGGIYLDNTTAPSFSNVLISQNYFLTNCVDVLTGSGSYTISNLIITNNYLPEYISLNANISGVISNNVIGQFLFSNVTNFNIKNNIFYGNYSTYIQGASNAIFNNIGISTNGLPANNGNQNGASILNLFVGNVNSTTDNQWKLSPSSGALGAGVGGVDCGMYGGLSPYVVSGLPPVPSIYLLTAPVNSNGNQLPITIGVKSNN